MNPQPRKLLDQARSLHRVERVAMHQVKYPKTPQAFSVLPLLLIWQIDTIANKSLKADI
ncbi:MAG: hypothetical protein AAF215_24035 [Cyanobacteria bacterium P01_A01_bin.123]